MLAAAGPVEAWPSRVGRPHPLDLAGVGLVSVGLFGVVLGLVRGNAHGWTSPVGAGLVRRRARCCWPPSWPGSCASDHPMLDIRLFAHRGFAAVNVTALLFSFGMFGVDLLPDPVPPDGPGLLAAGGRHPGPAVDGHHHGAGPGGRPAGRAVGRQAAGGHRARSCRPPAWPGWPRSSPRPRPTATWWPRSWCAASGMTLFFVPAGLGGARHGAQGPRRAWPREPTPPSGSSAGCSASPCSGAVFSSRGRLRLGPGLRVAGWSPPSRSVPPWWPSARCGRPGRSRAGAALRLAGPTSADVAGLTGRAAGPSRPAESDAA